MSLTIEHKWISIEGGPGVPYHFPEPLPAGFRGQSSRPAIYRWVVYESEPGDLRRLYIGETEHLTRRVCGYLKPGPSQFTNLRMNALFREWTDSGLRVALEVLQFEPFQVQGVTMSMADLTDATVRRLLEGIFVIYYSRQGFDVLNA